MGEKHEESAELKALHDTSRAKNTTEGGACLTGHEPSFRKKKNRNTCNYRYQGYEQAKAESKIRSRLETYDWKESITTSLYKTKEGNWAPSYYCAQLPAPRPEDWHIDGPKQPVFRKTAAGKDMKIPTTMNFSQDTWPYWNNAHHIIPKGLFNSLISEQPAPAPGLIRQKLLEAKYNINHKINMFMLPQDQEVARILKLARHIQLRHDDGAGVSEIFTDHPVYNRMVQTDLEKIIDGYKKACDKTTEDGHPVPNPDVDKKKLETLSDKLMNQILDWGMAEPGASLDKFSSSAKPTEDM